MWRGALTALLVALWGGPSVAQDSINLGTPQAPIGSIRSPVLTVDPEVLFERSAFGQRVLADVRSQTELLAAENRAIEADLTAEEQSLTERRPTMDVVAFRAEADAFDAKVQDIRRAQDAKERALDRLEGTGRDQFLIAAQPILGRLMLERGAAVILDRRSVFLGFGAIDVTDAAVLAIDAELGDGSALSAGENEGAVPQTLPGTPVPSDE